MSNLCVTALLYLYSEIHIHIVLKVQWTSYCVCCLSDLSSFNVQFLWLAGCCWSEPCFAVCHSIRVACYSNSRFSNAACSCWAKPTGGSTVQLLLQHCNILTCSNTSHCFIQSQLVNEPADISVKWYSWLSISVSILWMHLDPSFYNWISKIRSRGLKSADYFYTV